MTFFCHYLLCLVKPVIISFNPYPHTKIGEEVWINCSAHGRPIPTLKWRRDKSNFDLIHGVQPDSKFDIVTLPSITSVMKETLIVCKVSILRNSALNHLKVHDLPFFHAKSPSSWANGLATIIFWVEKSLGKLEQILNRKILQCKPKFLQLLKNLRNGKKIDVSTSIFDESMAWN